MNSIPVSLRTGVAALAAALLAACAQLPEGHQTPTALNADALHLQSAATTWPDATWWKRFGDPTLDDLIARALADNPSLQVAQARVARAQAAVGIAGAARYPQAELKANSTRQRFTENSIYPPPLGGSINSMNAVDLNLSWELDFFGKHKAALESALGSARSAQAEQQAARIALAANVARAYYSLARLIAQHDVAAAMLAQREQTVTLVRERVQAGLDTRVEFEQAQGGVPEMRQQLESYNEQIALARHALAALIGSGPEATASLAPVLDTSHPLAVPATVPAELIGRRADIVAARWRVEAAREDVTVAKTQFYPNIDLVAFAGVSSLGLDNLFKSSSREFGAGPAISLPIFEGGRLRANLRARNADVDAAVASYNATLLDAVREVADLLVSSRSLQVQAQEQAQAQAAAETAYDLAVQRYRAGLGNYLTVLSAQTSVLAQRRAAVDLKARAWDLDVNLIRALGGGFDAESAEVALHQTNTNSPTGAMQ